jgi:hypothetical protein
MVRLTKWRKKALTALRERAMDVYDLADAMRELPDMRFIEQCENLRDCEWAEWMYPDDPISITPAGRQALEAHHEQ